MLFSSISFLYYFFPITIIIYFLSKSKYKNIILLLSSLFFYFYGEPKYTLLMLLSAFSGYIHGILIDKYRTSKYSKLFLISSLVISLGILTVFKYGDFIISNINYISGANIRLLKLALPIGISFYTFQTLSYVVDVYRNEAKVCKSFIDFATYICLFPQLIAGPIVRYTTIQEELNYRVYSFENFAYGVNRFIIGLSKKVIIANNLGLLVDVLNQTMEKSTLSYWIVAIAFPLQIYYDFSGYSDMAIGIGRMFGFHFLENFNYPYISKSITEFWRRWHITLGSWFREYVYIPLGGNRVNKGRLVFNLFIVWFLTGFWHGASYNFIMWGIYFFILIGIEKLGLLNFLEKHKIFSHIYSIFFILIGWALFSVTDLSQLKALFIKLFNMTGGIDWIYYIRNYGLTLIIATLFSTPIIEIVYKKVIKNKLINTIILLCIFLISIAYLVDATYNPFLYFRF